MPIGNSLTSNFQLNSQAGQLAVTLRDTCDKILRLQNWVTQVGSSGLQNIGFTAPDADAFIQEVGYMNTVALVFTGQVQQGGTGGIGASQFNFKSALAAMAGPA